jgi:oligopeptidase B
MRIIFQKVDPMHRPYSVYLHKIGSNQENDILVFTEPDDQFFIDITRTKDDQWILISANSKDTSEVYLIDAHQPHKPIMSVQKREAKVRYYVDHAKGKFYSVTNRNGAHCFKLVTCDSHALLNGIQNNNPDRVKLWKDMIPHHDKVSILDVDIFTVPIFL